MTALLYGTRAYQRNNGNLPELKLRNMFLESSPTSEEGVILLSRKGFIIHQSLGSSPVDGLFSQENVFDGSLFAVSGGSLYKDGTLVGTISGSDPVSFAAGSATELLICAGESLHRYDGSALTVVTFPDTSNVSSVVFHDGLYIASKKGANQFYWSDVLDGSTWDALSFASAEAKPDNILDLKIVNDFLYIFGSETIERWANTGVADAPYSRVEGAIINKGVKDTGASTGFENSIFFVDNDGIVYILDEGLRRVSDNGIEEKIKQSATVSTFTFIEEGHIFFCLRLDTRSFLYDLTTQEWCEFTSYGKTNWRAQCACVSNSVTVFGDSEEGVIWEFSGWTDNDQPLERLFTAAFPVKGGTVTIDNLMIEANVGWTEDLTGSYTNPVIEMRASRDAGVNWGSFREAHLGEQGNYRVRPRWRRLGMFDFPGGMFEFRLTDPTSFRVSTVMVNEEGGGRSR